jgi:hypothetical protein
VVGHRVPVLSRIRAHSAPTRWPRVGKCRYTVRAAIPDRSAIASCDTVRAGSSRTIVIALSRMAVRVDSRCRSCADRTCGLVMTVYCQHGRLLSRARVKRKPCTALHHAGFDASRNCRGSRQRFRCAAPPRPGVHPHHPRQIELTHPNSKCTINQILDTSRRSRFPTTSIGLST